MASEPVCQLQDMLDGRLLDERARKLLSVVIYGFNSHVNTRHSPIAAGEALRYLLVERLIDDARMDLLDALAIASEFREPICAYGNSLWSAAADEAAKVELVGMQIINSTRVEMRGVDYGYDLASGLLVAKKEANRPVPISSYSLILTGLLLPVIERTKARERREREEASANAG